VCTILCTLYVACQLASYPGPCLKCRNCNWKFWECGCDFRYVVLAEAIGFGSYINCLPTNDNIKFFLSLSPKAHICTISFSETSFLWLTESETLHSLLHITTSKIMRVSYHNIIHNHVTHLSVIWPKISVGLGSESSGWYTDWKKWLRYTIASTNQWAYNGRQPCHRQLSLGYNPHAWRMEWCTTRSYNIFISLIHTQPWPKTRSMNSPTTMWWMGYWSPCLSHSNVWMNWRASNFAQRTFLLSPIPSPVLHNLSLIPRSQGLGMRLE